MITSKVIMVETGEVVFHNVVTSRATEDDAFSRFRGAVVGPNGVRWGVDQTIADLRQAFQLTIAEEQLVQSHENKKSQ